MTDWLESTQSSDFTIDHLPFGIFRANGNKKRVGVAIGDEIIDLYEFAKAGLLGENSIAKEVFESDFLNDFMSLGKEASSKVRAAMQAELRKGRSTLDQHAILVKQREAELFLPVKVGDYTDFYSSEEHATNVGVMFRGPENALKPNWKHLPVGYHGRASSIIVSGQNIHRPKGQKAPMEEGGNPGFGASNRLDIELETAFVTCKSNALGSSISTDEADDYIWGFALFNDWSARDIQKWEYVPLGPFLGKSFASSLAAWITPMEALEPFRVQGPKQEPEVLPYLQYSGKKNYDIALEVWLETESGLKQKLSDSNFKYMYWNMCQQLAHHSVNGCNIQVGDLYGSGTISGKGKGSFGSLLEITWSGKEPIKLEDGTTRTFLKDGDTIVLKGYCDNGTIRFGLGEVRTKILPAQ